MSNSNDKTVLPKDFKSSLAKPKFNAFGFVEGYVCPSCGGPVKEDHTDDIGTAFYRCEKCGQVSARLKNVKKEKFLQPLKNAVRLREDPRLLEKFMLHLSRTVKRDHVTKNMVFLAGLSGYTKNPINLFLRGPSSIGKTYNVTQTLRYFPEIDVWMLGSLSPTALIHSYGIVVDGSGSEIDFLTKPGKKATEEEKREWNRRISTARTLVDLHGKILVFLEAPNLYTYNMLRPILSHDKEEISYKFTDKTAKGQLRTTHVVIEGWPATIFCTTEEKYIHDLATRGFTVTPETETEKFKEANLLTGEKKALPWKYHDDDEFMLLQELICWLRDKLEGLNVAIPYARELSKSFPASYARSMRDFSHLTALIEVLALFHCMQRPVLTRTVEGRGESETVTDEENYILATPKDLEYIVSLWKAVEETTITGLPQQILDFYHKAVEPLSQQTGTFNIQELTAEYNKEANDRKSSDTVGRWVQSLCDVGYLSKEPDPLDKRKVTISIIKKPEEIRNYPQSLNADTFRLETFKAWLNEANQITARNHILLKRNLMVDEESQPEDIFNEFFLGETGLHAVISPSPNQPSPDKQASELSVNQKCGDLRITPDRVQTSPLERIRDRLGSSTFSEPNFLDLAKNTGLSQKEAEETLQKWLDDGLVWRVDDGAFYQFAPKVEGPSPRSGGPCEVCGRPGRLFLRNGEHIRCDRHLEDINL